MTKLVPSELINNAISNGVRRYIAQRRVMIDAFVTKHYSITGATKLHKHALGWDLIKVPTNIILSIVNLLLALLRFIAPKSLSNIIRKAPFVVKTNMGKELEK